MPPTSERDDTVQKEIPATPIYAKVAGIGLLILGIVAYGFYLGNRLISVDAPRVNAIGKIGLEAAIAGLMLEETMSTGIAEELGKNWEPLDAAMDDLRQQVVKQAGWRSALLPFRTPGLQNDLDELDRKLVNWKTGAERRVRDEGFDFIRGAAEIRYQAAFAEFTAGVKRLENRLRSNLNENQKRFHYAQVVLILSCLALTLVAGMVLYRYERQRNRHLKELLMTGERLTKEIDSRRRTARELAIRTEALERSNRDLQQFAHIASHDLQEPLRMVTSYVNLLERRYKGKLDRDADDFIAFAVDGAARMQRMIHDLLTYSRVETRGDPFSRTDSMKVFSQVLADLKVAIEESGAHITHNQLPLVEADPTQLAQVFQNLIANAIRFRRDMAPTVHVSAHRKGQAWVFAVVDNGIGFEPQFADRIFTLFQRLHTQETYPGSGMGLSICKRIIERHGGSIWAESTPGAGSTFYFSLTASEND